MKKLILSNLILAASLFSLHAADEVTKEGVMSCAKCNLKIESSCADVLTVTEDGKEVQFWLLEDGKAKTSAHKCSGTVNATVTGTVEEKDGKMILTVASIEKK